MKKKIAALFLALLTFMCIFALAACKGGKGDGKDDNKGQTNLPDPDSVDGLTLIVGNWVVSELQVVPEGESGIISSPVATESYRLEIRENGEFTFSRYTDKDESYEGKAENGIALNYYEFSCTMGDATVTASAYLYPDNNTLVFSSIAFEGAQPEYTYSSCTCVRGV